MLRLSSAPLSALRGCNTRVISGARRGCDIQVGMKNRPATLSYRSSRACVGRIWIEIKFAQLLASYFALSYKVINYTKQL